MARIVNETIESGMCHPMIIIMPDASGENARHCGRHTGYQNQEGWAYEDYFFNELIPHVEKTYRIIGDRAHRAIAGLSMGGHGTFMYASHHPEMFSSACPMSARLTGVTEVDEDHDQAYIDDMKNNDFVKKFPTYSAEKIEAMKTVRWLFDCGDDDKLLDGTLKMYMLMREQGFNAELRVRNGGHAQRYWRDSLPLTLTFVSIGFTEH
jgi:enterochelin esterase-like enzyme